MFRRLISIAQRLLGIKSEEPLARLPQLLGFTPHDWSLYELAFTHSSLDMVSKSGFRIDNERLEFLGDSVLSTAITHHLYLVYPEWSEGNLSQRRSELVQRRVNNVLGRQMDLHKMLNHRLKRDQPWSDDIYGNTLEALIGAIFLDRGYATAERFILLRVLPLFRKLEPKLVEQTTNYKSLLYHFVQRHALKIEFRMLAEPKRQGGIFTCAVFIDDKRISIGKGYTKKESHQEAAHLALDQLKASDPSIALELDSLS